MATREGGCQCGALRYRIQGEPKALALCFCSECQRQSGSAFGMSLIVRREDFALLAGTPGCFSRPADSGSVVDCYFCETCGTRIHHSPRARPRQVNVKPGTLDEPSGLAPGLAVWTFRKPDWLSLPDALPHFPRNPGKA